MLLLVESNMTEEVKTSYALAEGLLLDFGNLSHKDLPLSLPRVLSTKLTCFQEPVYIMGLYFGVT